LPPPKDREQPLMNADKVEISGISGIGQRPCDWAILPEHSIRDHTGPGLGNRYAQIQEVFE
jgi:hypothetical protein